MRDFDSLVYHLERKGTESVRKRGGGGPNAKSERMMKDCLRLNQDRSCLDRPLPLELFSRRF